jgi:hypothetical protein
VFKGNTELKSSGVETPAVIPAPTLSKALLFSVAICALAVATALNSANIKRIFFITFVYYYLEYN